MAVETKGRPHAAQTSDRLRLEFLLLDLTTCTRCLGADRSLESALDIVREVLQATGVEVEVDKIVVESADQARALRFVISPTVRVDGHDVALELRESLCGSEACGDGCGDQIACRMWVHRGHEYTDPPVAMIVDAILGHVYGGAAAPGASEPEPYEPPEKLGHFFRHDRIGRVRGERLLFLVRAGVLLLRQLPAIHREALALTAIERLSQVSAAAWLGLSTSGMKSRVQRARAQLRQLLVACCDSELDRRGDITSYRSRRGPRNCRTTTPRGAGTVTPYLPACALRRPVLGRSG